MSHVRSLVRVASLLAVSLGLFAVRMLLVPVSVVAAGAEQRSGGWLFKVWGHACLRILGIRTQRDGTLPATSAGPYVIVSNHLGYLDIPLFAAHTGGIFVSNARIRRWPLIGFLAARIGTIFMRRSRKRAIMPAIEHIAAALNAGRPVIFFPEGTSSPGLTVMPFRSNLFEAVVHANVPVFCAAVRYSSPDPSIDPATDIAWSDTPLGQHAAKLLRISAMNAEMLVDGTPLDPGNRKELASQAHARVSALHNQIGQPSARR